MFTSRSGAARRAARTVVAERRSAAPPWRRAGARTRGPRSGRRAAGRGSRDRPGTVPQAGTGAGYLTGTRTREVTSQSRCAYSIRRGRRRPSPASGSGPRLSTSASARPQFRLGGSAGRPPAPTVRAWTDGARRRPRDAVGGSARGGRRPGTAAGMVWAAAVVIALGCGGAYLTRSSGRRAARARRGRDVDRTVDRARTAGKRRKGVRRPVLLARGLVAGGGAAGRGAVPGADAPLRSGTPGGRPHRAGGRRGARRRGGHGRLRRPARGPRGGVGAARGRAADHLRAGGPGRRGRDAGRAGRRARHARPRAPGLPGGVPALGGAPRTRELPGPAAADDAAARPAAAAARPVAGCLLSGPPPRGRRAAGR